MTATVALGGYTRLLFSFPEGAAFAAGVAARLTALGLPVSSSAVSISAAFPATEVLQDAGSFLNVQYAIGVQQQFLTSLRTYMSSALVGGTGSAFVSALQAAGLALVTEADLVSAPTLESATIQPLSIFKVEDFLATAEPTLPTYNLASATGPLDVNNLLKQYAPNVDPALAYQGQCASSNSAALWGLSSSLVVPSSFSAPQTCACVR